MGAAFFSDDAKSPIEDAAGAMIIKTKNPIPLGHPNPQNIFDFTFSLRSLLGVDCSLPSLSLSFTGYTHTQGRPKRESKDFGPDWRGANPTRI